jgi:hypothetical protein
MRHLRAIVLLPVAVTVVMPVLIVPARDHGSAPDKAWSRAASAPFARPGPGTGIFRTLAGGDDFAAGTLDRVRIDGTGALALDPAGGDSGLREGTDTTGVYNGGR